MKQFLISIDDTDDVSKATSTGNIAEKIGKYLTEEEGGRMIDGISRHQLLLSDQIDYTSHNSSMCFRIEFKEESAERTDLNRVAEICERIIRENMAETADPGLAVLDTAVLKDPDRLIGYGFETKRMVKTKEEACQLAETEEGLILHELGGDGSGVIGALAGIGLRMSRSDGAIKGKQGRSLAGATLLADEICTRFGAEKVVCTDGMVLDGKTPVCIREFVKLMFFNGSKVCLVRKGENGRYELICRHQEQEKIIRSVEKAFCEDFVTDNDEDEMPASGGMRSCFNCLYRRWIGENGFCCMKEDQKL